MGAHQLLHGLPMIKELGLMEEQWVICQPSTSRAHQLLLGLLMIKEPGLMEANHHGT